MLCAWCQAKELTDPRARFCCQKCRQAAFRLRSRRQTEAQESRPMRMCYADPPYPGLAKKYYGKEESFGGEVDHVALVASLRYQYDGWALSTSSKALRDVLPLCPPEARVCAWYKPVGAAPATRGLHGIWEPVIVVPGRHLRPGVPDALRAHAARGGGTLPGRKPLAFVAWLFDCLGLLPGDELTDLFPGTGIVGRAWREASLGAVSHASLTARADAYQEYSTDAAPGGGGDVSLRAAQDESSPEPAGNSLPR